MMVRVYHVSFHDTHRTHGTNLSKRRDEKLFLSLVTTKKLQLPLITFTREQFLFDEKRKMM